ncbi:hypothetical protein CF088_19165 [Clostridium botulinum]|nr:hypothetical protein [Clostridium botulinum]APH23403.1 hypothetical protein NPD1_3065 [Clostridium botulinum]APQ68421.1 hypothetical protein RSJ8_1191 [Clostridium botulinum]MBN3380743.1 hypothetical protein [Clostridium botulinum]MBN3407344.1 hypothetical protein [Clostridium botulinum]
MYEFIAGSNIKFNCEVKNKFDDFKIYVSYKNENIGIAKIMESFFCGKKVSYITFEDKESIENVARILRKEGLGKHIEEYSDGRIFVPKMKINVNDKKTVDMIFEEKKNEFLKKIINKEIKIKCLLRVEKHSGVNIHDIDVYMENIKMNGYTYPIDISENLLNYRECFYDKFVYIRHLASIKSNKQLFENKKNNEDVTDIVIDILNEEISLRNSIEIISIKNWNTPFDEDTRRNDYHAKILLKDVKTKEILEFQQHNYIDVGSYTICSNEDRKESEFAKRCFKYLKKNPVINMNFRL